MGGDAIREKSAITYLNHSVIWKFIEGRTHRNDFAIAFNVFLPILYA